MDRAMRRAREAVIRDAERPGGIHAMLRETTARHLATVRLSAPDAEPLFMQTVFELLDADYFTIVEFENATIIDGAAFYSRLQRRFITPPDEGAE